MAGLFTIPGAVADAAVITWFLALPVIGNAIAAAVYANNYIDLFLSNLPQGQDAEILYYTAEYVRGLGIVTSIVVFFYVGWIWMDGRHVYPPDKKPGPFEFTSRRLHAAGVYGPRGIDVEKIKDEEEKKRAMAANRGRLIGFMFLLFVMWFVPTAIFFAKGWLFWRYENKSHDNNAQGITCTFENFTSDCENIWEAGISDATECGWILLSIGANYVVLGSTSPDNEQFEKMRKEIDKSKKDAKDKETEATKKGEEKDEYQKSLERFKNQLSQAYPYWRDGDDLPFPLIFSVLKTLTGQDVTVELKNDLSIQGTLKSVDQFLNIKLDNIDVQNPERYPHLLAVKNMFIRGSVVRYVQLPKAAVDTQLLEDATRKGKSGKSN
ncbi:MAG: hypothetical protein CYPHOPRED_005063 [Cyphobasidiales sp. Tagirdzhanova-0007]|nr:MAG: hypothetical protein CYPHOPRED_005063 [Cyphobasidiales sp. Tagirdzhanova-0007]